MSPSFCSMGRRSCAPSVPASKTGRSSVRMEPVQIPVPSVCFAMVSKPSRLPLWPQRVLPGLSRVNRRSRPRAAGLHRQPMVGYGAGPAPEQHQDTGLVHTQAPAESMLNSATNLTSHVASGLGSQLPLCWRLLAGRGHCPHWSLLVPFNVISLILSPHHLGMCRSKPGSTGGHGLPMRPKRAQHRHGPEPRIGLPR